MILDYKDIDDLNRYKIMSGTVIPRPIAWIVTDDDGVLNAAPFSYFIPISSNPALLQNHCDKKYIGRVISYNDMFFMLANVLTTLFIGTMAHITTTSIITICLGVAFLLYAYYYTKIYSKI